MTKLHVWIRKKVQKLQTITKNERDDLHLHKIVEKVTLPMILGFDSSPLRLVFRL